MTTIHAQTLAGGQGHGKLSHQSGSYHQVHQHVKRILPDPQRLAQAADVLLALTYPMDRLEQFAFWGLFGERLDRAYRGVSR